MNLCPNIRIQRIISGQISMVTGLAKDESIDTGNDLFFTSEEK